MWDICRASGARSFSLPTHGVAVGYPVGAPMALGRVSDLVESELVPAGMIHYASDVELSKAEWPFDCEPHTGTYVSRCVMEDGAPIVRAVHDWDGEWQFIGPVDDPNEDGAKLSCFHCVVERDPTIKLLAGMPAGVRALRESPSAKWTWEEIERETE